MAHSVLLLVHGAALFGMLSFADSLTKSPALLTYLTPPAWSFVTGLMLALFCGLSTWLNWFWLTLAYNQQADIAMLWDENRWLAEPSGIWKITFTFWASIILGLASAFAIVVGAAFLLHGKSWLPLVGSRISG